MRVISFSADGLKEAEKAGFYEWVRDQDADFICIQDIRCSEYDLRKDSFFRGNTTLTSSTISITPKKRVSRSTVRSYPKPS